MSSLAILIDCWKVNDNLYYETVMDNIVEYCHDDEEITAIALSCYSNEPYDGCKSDNWITNSDCFFSQETKWDFLRKNWASTNWADGSEIHEKIAGIVPRENQILFTALTDYQIMYYCNYINPSITKIYFMGHAWDVCIKNRPVGWLSIASLQHHNLISDDIDLCANRSCVYDNDTQIPDIRSPWYNVKDQIWKLNLEKISW